MALVIQREGKNDNHNEIPWKHPAAAAAEKTHTTTTSTTGTGGLLYHDKSKPLIVNQNNRNRTRRGFEPGERSAFVPRAPSIPDDIGADDFNKVTSREDTRELPITSNSNSNDSDVKSNSSCSRTVRYNEEDDTV